MSRLLTAIIMVSLAGCTATSTTSLPENTGSSVETTSTTAAVSTTTTAGPTTDGTDLLSFYEGVTVAAWRGPDSTNPQVALQLVDGDPGPVLMATGNPGTIEVVYTLPAATTFHSFSVPEVEAVSGNATGFSRIAIFGSSTGPDTGFFELASGTLLGPGEGEATYPTLSHAEVRWVRISLEGTASPVDERTRVEFNELVGFGTQQERPLWEGFGGVWVLRPADRPESAGERLELSQAGSIVTGCLDSVPVRGVANGPVAKLTGVDAPSTAIVLVAGEGQPMVATLSTGNRRFQSRTATAGGDSRSSSCRPPLAAEAVCQAPLYVNFARDSAEIRTESDRVLDDIYRTLVDLGVTTVTVEGHTSTEGSESHNLELSTERAQAVADALASRGFPKGGIAVAGLGESRPLITPDEDEASRAINRRVELVCGN